MSGRQSTKRPALVQEVDRWGGEVEAWESKGADAAERAEVLREGVGAAVLDNPGAASEVSEQLRVLSVDADVAVQAVVAAEQRLQAARRAVVEFDCAELEQQAASVAERLRAHEARKVELLQALCDHEGGRGEFVHVGAREFAAQMAGIPPGSVDGVFRNERAETWKSDTLKLELQKLTLMAEVGRDVLAGVDPRARLRRVASVQDSTVLGVDQSEFYPPSVWGPDAMIEAPASASSRNTVGDREAATA